MGAYLAWLCLTTVVGVGLNGLVMGISRSGALKGVPVRFFVLVIASSNTGFLLLKGWHASDLATRERRDSLLGVVHSGLWWQRDLGGAEALVCDGARALATVQTGFILTATLPAFLNNYAQLCHPDGEMLFYGPAPSPPGGER